MKKISIILMAFILAVSTTACGRRDNKNPATTPTTIPATTAPTTTPTTTAPTIAPEIPEIETNIPDPSVNENSTEDFMDSTNATNPSQDSSRARRRHTGK